MLNNPILFEGSETSAYRDPAAIIVNGICHLFFTFVDNRPGGPWLYLAETTSSDLEHWSDIRVLTPKDKRLNYSSPGNVVRDGADYVICFQTYCRENGEKYGNDNCRIYTMRSKDLRTWSEPALIPVKGDHIEWQDMGRMIDPYLLRAGDEWWCFYKQNGVSFSKSFDLKSWTYMGNAKAGENVCVIPFKGGYRMFSSPENGIRVMDSYDLVTWHQSMDDLTLGQESWDWAKGRLTAGFVLENSAGFGNMPRYLMFFHASRFPEAVQFDSYASIAMAYSEDLTRWQWPGIDRVEGSSGFPAGVNLIRSTPAN